MGLLDGLDRLASGGLLGELQDPAELSPYQKRQRRSSLLLNLGQAISEGGFGNIGAGVDNHQNKQLQQLSFLQKLKEATEQRRAMQQLQGQAAQAIQPSAPPPPAFNAQAPAPLPQNAQPMNGVQMAGVGPQMVTPPMPPTAPIQAGGFEQSPQDRNARLSQVALQAAFADPKLAEQIIKVMEESGKQQAAKASANELVTVDLNGRLLRIPKNQAGEFTKTLSPGEQLNRFYDRNVGPEIQNVDKLTNEVRSSTPVQMSPADVANLEMRKQEFGSKLDNEDFSRTMDQARLNLDKVRLGLEQQRVGMEGQRLGIEGQRLDLDRTKAMGEQKALSADAAKVYSITQSMPSQIKELRDAFSGKNYRSTVTGILSGTDTNLGRLVDNLADQVGRLRSGGAVNVQEATSFKGQLIRYMDAVKGNPAGALAALQRIEEEAAMTARSIRPNAQQNPIALPTSAPPVPAAPTAITSRVKWGLNGKGQPVRLP